MHMLSGSHQYNQKIHSLKFRTLSNGATGGPEKHKTICVHNLQTILVYKGFKNFDRKTLNGDAYLYKRPLG